MSRAELVQSYRDGQLSRRVFIRGMIATGVSAASALAYAGILESTPAGAAPIADFYLVMEDNFFRSTPTPLQQGQGVEFANHGASAHNARETSGMGLFDTGLVPAAGAATIDPLPGAGDYGYRCDDNGHVAMRGRLRVPVVATPRQAPLGRRFTVRWAKAAPPPGLRFDVQRRRPGARGYANWRRGVTARAAVFRPTRRGTWAFRARVRRPSTGKASRWSQPVTIRVR